MEKRWIANPNVKEVDFLDIRIEKTERAIKQAFMELRAQKPLEKIKVKELCDLACINKSTFYAFFRKSNYISISTCTSCHNFALILNIIFIGNFHKVIGNIFIKYRRKTNHCAISNNSAICLVTIRCICKRLENRRISFIYRKYVWTSNCRIRIISKERKRGNSSKWCIN